MATYSGMSLKGEVRESISLDEDDLSDVEDEVFIRDGKHGYKLAEELNMKRPLMAPRRRLMKSDINSVQRHKQSCKIYCKPCCYICAALSIFIGLITLVAVLVSMYPLPLDKIKEWTVKKTQKEEILLKLLPCNNLKVTDVWSVNLPKIASDSSVRTIDINEDGIEDILFGFGLGEDYKLLPPKEYCSIFVGVLPPCEGGIIALNGLNGEIIWRYWINDTIFSLQCTADINGDQMEDCLATGEAGTILTINPKNGTLIWIVHTGREDLYVANFIPDQNNDNISDILSSHSTLNNVTKDGHIVLFSGRTGEEINEIETSNGIKTFYLPQVLLNSTDDQGNILVCFGTGTPSTPGTLSTMPLWDIVYGKNTNRTKILYSDIFKGVITPSILVDITGDAIPDIVTATLNSTLIAINGKTFEQIWNFTVPGSNSETTVGPTPGYFTFDNITDFLIIYQSIDDILNYTYTQTFIIDGKTGESIYNPISGSTMSQMSGLTLSMESFGYDIFLFWTVECPYNNINGKKRSLDDDCRNSSKSVKLNALGQFHQPPGFTIFSSGERDWKFLNDSQCPLKKLREYYRKYPKLVLNQAGQSEVDEDYNTASSPIIIRKYGTPLSKIKDNENEIQDIQDDYQWGHSPPESRLINDQDKIDSFYDYPDSVDDITIDQKQNMLRNRKMLPPNSRDPRNRDKVLKKNSTATTTTKKNLSDSPLGMYDTHNIRLSKNRLLHDLDHLPNEILKDTFFKNEENRLRRSKFEQRDVNTHYDKMKEKEEIRKIIRKEIDAVKNSSFNLWDLESEKELKDRIEVNLRGKRGATYDFDGTTKIISVGAVVNPLNQTNASNSIDVIVMIYRQQYVHEEQEMLRQDLKECVNEKIEELKGDNVLIDKDKKNQLKRDCVEEQETLKNEFSYFHRLNRLQQNQLTIFRLNVECECLVSKTGGKCATFLPKKNQGWPNYLGKFGNGVFNK